VWFGIRAPGSADELLAAAVEVARQADAVVLIVGETSDSSVESKDRADTLLPKQQIELIEQVTSANPRTVVVANVGHAYDAAWDGAAAAHVSAWYPGEGFSAALAAVLSGDREPGGRMPVSIAQSEADYRGYGVRPDAAGKLAYDEGVRVGYRGLVADGKKARYAFGSGCGYARFEWSHPSASGLKVAVDVRNVSNRAGAEVIQVYRDRPECTLVGFAKIVLEPGAMRTVEIDLHPRRLMTWSEGGWQPIGETVPVRIARSAEDPGHPLTVRLR
jgi:beta-glucosidase